ncbi:hypothetical protein BH20ACT19_BH20ACT19_10030 [soil metagenome]
MGTHMKTTIEIAESLLSEAKERARREGTTLRALVEEGLRRVLEDEHDEEEPFELLVVGGRGLKPGIEWKDLLRLSEEEDLRRRFPELRGEDAQAGEEP